MSRQIFLFLLGVVTVVASRASCDVNSTLEFFRKENVSYDVAGSAVIDGGTRLCVRKCCELEKVVTNKSCVTDVSKGVKFLKNISLDDESDRQNLLVFSAGIISCGVDGRYMLFPGNEGEFFTITSEGKLKNNNLIFGLDRYCVDYIESEDEIRALVCATKTPSPAHLSTGKLLVQY